MHPPVTAVSQSGEPPEFSDISHQNTQKGVLFFLPRRSKFIVPKNRTTMATIIEPYFY